MGFLTKARTVILGHMNDLLDKAVDMNSIPVLKQYIRDLEDSIDTARHQAAVSKAQVTTLSRDLERTKDSMATDERRASAYLSQNNEAAARQVASRIHDQQQTVATLTSQIATAGQQSSQLDTVVEKLQSKHDESLARVRQLEMTDRSTKAMEQATDSIKKAGAALDSNVDSNLDNLSHRIEERGDVAREEFNRSVGSLEQPEDPLKKAEVDSILDGLKAKLPVAV